MGFTSPRMTDSTPFYDPVRKVYYNVDDSYDDSDDGNASMKEICDERSGTSSETRRNQATFMGPSAIVSKRRSSSRNSSRSRQVETLQNGLGGCAGQAKPQNRFCHGSTTSNNDGSIRHKAFQENTRRPANQDYMHNCRGRQGVIPDCGRSLNKSTQTTRKLHGGPGGVQKANRTQKSRRCGRVNNDDRDESDSLSRDGIVSEQAIMYTGEPNQISEARVQGSWLGNVTGMLLVNSPPIYIPRR